jgi:hypothetical protein
MSHLRAGRRVRLTPRFSQRAPSQPQPHRQPGTHLLPDHDTIRDRESTEQPMTYRIDAEVPSMQRPRKER